MPKSNEQKQESTSIQCPECKKIYVGRESRNDMICMIGDSWVIQNKCISCKIKTDVEDRSVGVEEPKKDINWVIDVLENIMTGEYGEDWRKNPTALKTLKREFKPLFVEK